MLEPFRTCGCEHSVSMEGSQEANLALTVHGFGRLGGVVSNSEHKWADNLGN